MRWCIRLLTALWDWLCALALGPLAGDWEQVPVPPLRVWSIVDITGGRYRICSVHRDLDAARKAFDTHCRFNDDKYVWLIEVIDIHRPSPWRS